MASRSDSGSADAVEVSFDEDEGWIVEVPIRDDGLEDAEMEFAWLHHDGVERPSTRADAEETGRALARTLGLPLRVFNRSNGRESLPGRSSRRCSDEDGRTAPMTGVGVRGGDIPNSVRCAGLDLRDALEDAGTQEDDCERIASFLSRADVQGVLARVTARTRPTRRATRARAGAAT
ncbi:MAG: hypothetical protein ACYC5V_15525 [Gemmatimonadaceae bacterium]